VSIHQLLWLVECTSSVTRSHDSLFISVPNKSHLPQMNPHNMLVTVDIACDSRWAVAKLVCYTRFCWKVSEEGTVIFWRYLNFFTTHRSIRAKNECELFNRLTKRIAVCATSTAPLRELTCHIGSHSVTCHLAEVTFPPLPQPIKACTRFSDPKGIQGWVHLVWIQCRVVAEWRHSQQTPTTSWWQTQGCQQVV